MKKLFCIIATLAITIIAFAQEDSSKTGNVHIVKSPDTDQDAGQGHLTFKNIPISGPLSSFIDQLKSAGFTLEYEADNGAIMKGAFAGFTDCEIIIACSQKSKTVWKVVADLPDQSSWSSVRSRYNEFKDRYTKKYGVPNNSFAFFSRPYYDGDGYELQAIKNEKGHFMTYWETDLGTIAVTISASSSYEGQVELWYQDSASSAIKDTELAQVVDDDI